MPSIGDGERLTLVPEYPRGKEVGCYTVTEVPMIRGPPSQRPTGTRESTPDQTALGCTDEDLGSDTIEGHPEDYRIILAVLEH